MAFAALRTCAAFALLVTTHVGELNSRCPHVLYRLRLPAAQAATVDEVAHTAAGVLASLGHRRAHFVGHSYGTFVISRICQLYPDVSPGSCPQSASNRSAPVVTIGWPWLAANHRTAFVSAGLRYDYVAVHVCRLSMRFPSQPDGCRTP